jgi:hypothetical protein
LKLSLAPAVLALSLAIAPLLTAGAADDAPGGGLPPAVVPLPIPPELEPAGSIPPPAFSPGAPAAPAGRRVLDVVESVRAKLRETRYQHATDVDEQAGLYAWDCSGMAAWILRRAAPRALAAVTSERPVARDFYQVISRAGPAPFRAVWHRLSGVSEIRPGDVFAWVRPPKWPSHNTGHVGFVLSRAEPVAVVAHAYAVRVVDATSLPHQDDTRSADGVGGFGEGTLLFLTDGDGRPTAYGWYGTESRAVIETRIVLGRL